MSMSSFSLRSGIRVFRMLVTLCIVLTIATYWYNKGYYTLRHYRNTTMQSYNSTALRISTLLESINFQTPEVEPTTSVTGLRIVSLMDTHVQLYSVIGRNSSNTSYWDTLAVSGWENKSKATDKYTCCLKYGDNDFQILSAPIIEKFNWPYIEPASTVAKLFVCPNIKSKEHLLPTGVSLVYNGQNCSSNDSLYVIPEFPHRAPPKSIAVRTKIAYGKLSASAIIEWFEVHKRMGVQKVITYTNDLNADAMKVLRHYQSEGIGELHPFILPDKDGVQHELGPETFQAWSDEQIALYDCASRLSGYTYMSVIDFDEFIIPKVHTNWIHMLDHQFKRNPSAAGFMFRTEVYITSWGKIDNKTDKRIVAYQNRTVHIKDRKKYIVMPDRIRPGHLVTHSFWSRDSFTRKWMPADIGTLKHYRTCRKEWLEKNGAKCYKKFERVKDTSMVKMATSVEHAMSTVMEYYKIRNSFSGQNFEENSQTESEYALVNTDPERLLDASR